MKILKAIILLFLMLFIIFGLTGCSMEENTEVNAEEKSVYFTPVCYPTANGGLRMVMIPKIVEK